MAGLGHEETGLSGRRRGGSPSASGPACGRDARRAGPAHRV